MSKADKIKSIVKGPAPKSTFGTDPSDPWSTKANIAEFAGTPPGLLAKYLKSRGVNPKFASKDQKIAHSKTGQFQKWQRDHQDRASLTGTTFKAESVDKKDTVTFDIPLLIRVLELAREDIKSDMDLHRVVERLINMRDKGMLTMDDYDEIAQIKEEVSSSIPLEYIKDAIRELTEELEELDETWKYHTYPDNTVARAAVKSHHEFRDEKGMASGNPARAMGNGKVAYKGEFKGPKPQKVSEAKESNYGGDYQASVLAVKAKAEKKPVDMKSLAARMQASYAKDKKEVKEDISRRGILKGILGGAAAGAAGKASAIAGAFPSPSTRAKWAKDAEESNKAEAKRLADKKKKELENNTKEVDKAQRVNHHSLSTEETVAEGNGYDDNRTGFAKKPREDDEGHAPTKFKAKSIMDRPHTVHIDGKPWKKFSSGHQAHAAANTLTAKGKKATAIAHMSEDTYQDPQSATQTVFDGGNNPNDIAPPEYKGKRLIQMSKSARIIKNLYKQKGMKEETYDFEKADKSVESYGKPPKMKKTDKAITDGDKEQAAIVLSGGKTLTGDDRDTVEIDPKMKMRPNQQPEPVKSGNPQVK
jgi:hypothetical protein